VPQKKGGAEKKKKMTRGRRLDEVLSQEELHRKRDAPLEYVAPREEHANKPDVLSRIWDAKSTVFTFLRRLLLCFVVVTVALVVHMQEGFRVRVAALVGTTSSSASIQLVSTALPLSAVSAVLVAWFV
jgi:hypothetical protein